MLFPSTNAIILVALLLALPVHLLPLADDDKDAENNNSSGLTASGIMKGLTTGLAFSACLPGADSARPIQQAQGAPANYVTAQPWAQQPLEAAQQLGQMLPPMQMKMTSDDGQASLSTVHQRRMTTSINTTEHLSKKKNKKKCKKHPERCHNGVYEKKERGCC